MPRVVDQVSFGSSCYCACHAAALVYVSHLYRMSLLRSRHGTVWVLHVLDSELATLLFHSFGVACTYCQRC